LATKVFDPPTGRGPFQDSPMRQGAGMISWLMLATPNLVTKMQVDFAGQMGEMPKASQLPMKFQELPTGSVGLLR
jgi:hypothetical protein